MPVKKSQDRWGDAHVRLRKLFEERAGMSQLEFAEKHGLGTQGMVWQYLSGYRPLNFEAAAKFAKGLGCTIRDISPEMEKALRAEILPVLAKAAVTFVLVLPPLLALREVACVLCSIAMRYVRVATRVCENAHFRAYGSRWITIPAN
jgi:transcriptional regulator with XRE-family HTH domain